MSSLCRFAGMTACLFLCAHLSAVQSAAQSAARSAPVSFRPAAAGASSLSAPPSAQPQAATGVAVPSPSTFLPPPGWPAPPHPSMLRRVLEVLSAEEMALRFMAAPAEGRPSELQMLYEAREHVRRATTMDLGDGVWLRLDPLKLRCRLKMKL